MTSLDLLLRAILADPADNIPRKMYADEILEQKNDQDRCDLIKLQIEEAEDVEPDPKKQKLRHERWRRRKNKRRRVISNLYHVKTRLFAELPGYVSVRGGRDLLSVDFDRGFIHSAGVNIEYLVGGRCRVCMGQTAINDRGQQESCGVCNSTGQVPSFLEALFRSQPITRLRVRGPTPTPYYLTQPFGRTYWRRMGRPAHGGHIDPVVFDLMALRFPDRLLLHRGARDIYFDDSAHAEWGLGTGYIDLGRQLAGLPRLQTLETKGETHEV